MAKIVPVVAGNPEVAIPGIVAIRGYDTYRNVSTLHDAYNRMVGGPVDGSSVPINPGPSNSTSGTYIINPRRARETAPSVPVQSASLDTSPSSGTFIARPPQRMPGDN